MSDADRTELRHFLVVNYADLSQRLTRRLGSPEAANDALQETYLRLESASVLSPVRNPLNYLFRTALNIAADRRRAETRYLTTTEIDTLLDFADDAPDPARIVEGRSELRALERAIAEMPERRRAIFQAVLVEKTPRRELAKRFGISIRTVDIEVQRALEYGARRLQENSNVHCETAPGESSID
ncbi:sigma-70 family RNA polymerase sigma factor [Hyphomicrobium sp. xq]|uniref:Sigma-70 family RNA polymerase sigma factor n=1 Tax=Hyphomicrobium album TaxID=2665159 RepID=A0A6I3KFE0_9HYPH|nr:RNA polymerase sigma factor [Hyphomicrobium album]MTD92730.1 sigma-70 family RNA polymerase sigma factor [Hyphomicrobium album]